MLPRSGARSSPLDTTRRRRHRLIVLLYRLITRAVSASSVVLTPVYEFLSLGVTARQQASNIEVERLDTPVVSLVQLVL